MEAEIVSMCLRMYNNPDGAGAMTSGGTESIIMAIKAHRDWAKSTKGITEPEMWAYTPFLSSKVHAKISSDGSVIPSSAHAAFDKGAAYLKIKVHTIPVDFYTRKVDLKRVKRAMSVPSLYIYAWS
jgi:sphinganine-1-phosphate aldolase